MHKHVATTDSGTEHFRHPRKPTVAPPSPPMSHPQVATLLVSITISQLRLLQAFIEIESCNRGTCAWAPSLNIMSVRFILMAFYVP